MRRTLLFLASGVLLRASAQYEWTATTPPGFTIADVFYDDGTIHAVSDDPVPALAISDDGGAGWSYPAMIGGPQAGITELRVGVKYDGTIFLFGYDTQLRYWCSTDGGATFTLPGQGWLDEGLHIRGMRRGGFNDGLFGIGNVYWSNPLALCSSGSADGPTDHVDLAIRFDSAYAISSTGLISKGPAAGMAFGTDITPGNVGLGGAGGGIAVGSDPAVVHAAGGGDRIIRSSDGGNSWEATTAGISTAGDLIGIAATYWTDDVLAVQADHAYVSEDAGDSYALADDDIDFGSGVRGLGCGEMDARFYLFTDTNIYLLDITTGEADVRTPALRPYPQPTNGPVFLGVACAGKAVQLIDLSGRLALRTRCNTDGWLQLDELAPGSYALRVAGDPLRHVVQVVR